MKRGLCAALALALALTLSACSSVSFDVSGGSGPAVLPVPSEAPLSAPVGDSRARYSMRATLYYFNNDGALTPALRLLYVYQEDDPLTCIIEALLEPPYSSSGLSPIAPEGTRLLSAELSCGVATVSLSADLLSGGEEAVWRARAAIARTLLEQDGVQAVQVLVEGMAPEAADLPMGALASVDASSVSYEQFLAERRLAAETGTDSLVERLAVVYLNADGVLVPRAVLLSAAQDKLPTALLREALLANGFPEDAQAASATLSLSASGRKIAVVRLPAAVQGDPGLAAAITMSIARFLPSLSGVRFLGAGNVAAEALPTDQDGCVDPSALSSMLGSEITLFFPREDGTLARTTRAVSGLRPSARALLRALLAGPKAGSGLSPVFPAGTQESDILGLRVEDGVAHVNLSASLYSACQSLDAAGERALIFAIVNTLVAGADPVTQVQFYVAGAYADTLAGHISLRSPLMADPGLVR